LTGAPLKTFQVIDAENTLARTLGKLYLLATNFIICNNFEVVIHRLLLRFHVTCLRDNALAARQEISTNSTSSAIRVTAPRELFPRFFEEMRISNLGLKGVIRRKYEFVINNRNLYLSSSIIVRHCLSYVGPLV
jgi:hypothetical protein